MLKTRRNLAIILTVISVIVVLLILGSALFSLQSVTVEFMVVQSENSVLTTYNKEQMVKTGKFSYGKNILFLDYSNNIARIEAAYPYARVLSVERRFPNKAIVHVVEREPMFKVAQSDGSCYVLDADLKVLEHSTGTPSSVVSNLPEWESFSLGENVKVGSFISGSNSDLFKQIILNINSGIISRDVKLRISILSNITLVNSGEMGTATLTLTTDDYVQIKISGINNLAEKVLGAFNIYQEEVASNSTTYPDKSNVVITVTENFDLNSGLGISVSGGVQTGENSGESTT